MSKVILTEEQHTKILNEILKEMVQNTNNINEGVWEKIKYGLSKLGRYKANGKILGKGKVDQEAAEKIKAIIEKKGNELIAQLDAQIKETNPKFPNNEKEVDFLNTILGISAVYDSIIAATQKGPNDEGYMPVDAANGVINDLREYVKKFLDVDLTAVYSVVDEIEGNTLELTEEEEQMINETWELNENLVEDEASNVRTQLQAKRGQGDDFDSERMKTLKSNKLPLVLAGIGTSLGALGWMAQTDWFKTWLEGLLGGDKTITEPDVIQQITGGAPDSNGMLHWMGQIDGHEMKTGADVQQFIDKYGADNVKHMFDGNGGGSPDTQIQQLQQLVSGENANKPVGELFNKGDNTYGSMKGGQNLFGISKAASFLASIVVKKGISQVVKGAGTALAASLSSIGSVLVPIGIGLISAGALVKLMRMKGQKQSRAKTLNDLYQSIRNIEGGTGIISSEGETIDQESAQNPNAINNKNKEGGNVPREKSGTNDSESNDELYNSLRNLFQFIVNNRNMLGTRSADNVGTGAAISSGRMKAGDTYNYNGQSVTILKPDLGDGRTQVRSQGKAKNVFTVPTDSLQRMNESQLFEAKYITDKRMVQFLNKNLSYDKLKSFENLMNRIEVLRDRIKKLTPTDKVLAGHLKNFNNNPIMVTDFKQMFNLSADNPKAANSLKAFIDDIFVTLYSGKYKFGSMIDKMSTLGGGNINKVDEGEEYNMVNPNKSFLKDAQDRGRFKANLLKFLSTAMNLFQYLHKLKKEGKLSSGKQNKGDTQSQTPKQDTQQNTPKGPATYKGQNVKVVDPPNVKLEPGNVEVELPNGNQIQVDKDEVSGINEKIMEEILRIKKIMFG
jgi:hypothetical protein